MNCSIIIIYEKRKRSWDNYFSIIIYKLLVNYQVKFVFVKYKWSITLQNIKHFSHLVILSNILQLNVPSLLDKTFIIKLYSQFSKAYLELLQNQLFVADSSAEICVEEVAGRSGFVCVVFNLNNNSNIKSEKGSSFLLGQLFFSLQKLVNIPETEKLELICSFVQRRNIQNEDKIQAMAVSGFNYSFFVQKGLTNDQVLISLVKTGVAISRQ
ncbi:Hypothetical_protein [Hexamita inflata]|uniref:Hypothetical_protein n=1 Tax=Hexamita inflata TaxID=28002 RepID=A0ABP1L3K1_9EUKA